MDEASYYVDVGDSGASAILPPATSLIVDDDDAALAITIRRPLWVLLNPAAWWPFVWVVLVTGVLPAALLLAVAAAIALEYFFGQNLGGHEVVILGPVIVVLLIVPIAVPIILWLGFTKTLIRVDADHLMIRHVGLLTRRQVRWPTHLVGDVRKVGPSIGIFSVDGRLLAKLGAFWGWEDDVILTLLRSAVGLSADDS